MSKQKQKIQQKQNSTPWLRGLLLLFPPFIDSLLKVQSLSTILKVMEKIVVSFFLVIKVVFLVTSICDRYQIAACSKVAHFFLTVEI